MPVKIFTIKFDFDRNRFDSMEIDEFCQNKKINHQQASFFNMDGFPYWTVYIDYEIIVAKDNTLHNLSKSQRALYMRLKEWRKEKAGVMGVPSFLVATNSQLEHMIKNKTVTYSALEEIKGYGKKKVAAHGDDIIKIIKKFYEYDQNK